MDSNTSIVSVSAFSPNATDNDYTIQDWKAKLEHLQYALNVMRARNMYWRGNLLEAKVTRRSGNATETYLDVTIMGKDYITKLDEMWSAVEARVLREVSLKTLFYSSAGVEMISKQSFGNRHSQMVSFGSADTNKDEMEKIMGNLVEQYEILIGLTQEREKLTLAAINAQRQAIALISETREHIDKHKAVRDLPKKHQERIIKTRIARTVINALLSRANSIDFQQIPELLAIKLKWRAD